MTVSKGVVGRTLEVTGAIVGRLVVEGLLVA